MDSSDWERRLDRIDGELNAIKDSVTTKQQWWHKWGIPATVGALITSLMVWFITSYLGLQSAQDSLNSQVNTLQGQA